MSGSSKELVQSIESFPLETVGAGRGTKRSVCIGSDVGPHFALRRFVMEPGGGMPNHTNTVEHEQYIIRGSAQVGIGDRRYEVKSGDVVFIPAGVPHWYEAGEEGFEFLCMVPNMPDTIALVDAGC